MAYIVVVYKDEEVDRFELLAPLTVGRAPDCEVTVRDIELSRHHCRIEPATDHEGGWVVSDLASKNGTIQEGKKISRHVLQDNDVIRLGRTRIKFHDEVFDASARKPAKHRPSDPHEVLSATVSGMSLGEAPPESDAAALPPSKPLPDNAPRPNPQPTEPASYGRNDVYSLVTEIHSSSWDSIYAGASQQKADRAEKSDSTIGQDGAALDPRRLRRPSSPVDLTLQAVPETDIPQISTGQPQQRSGLKRAWSRFRSIFSRRNRADPARL